MRSARGRRASSAAMHAGRRGRSSVSSFQVLISVCIGAAFTISMMWYHEYQYIAAEQQATSGPGLRGDGVVDSAPPVGGGGELEGKGAAPPNEGGDGVVTSSRQVDFVDVGGRIGGEDYRPPVGDSSAEDEETGGGDSIDPGGSGDGSSGGPSGSDGGGGGDGGDGGEGGVPDSHAELLEPSDDDKGQQGGASASSQQTQDGSGSGGGEPSVVVHQEPEPAENSVGQGGEGAGGAGGAQGGGGGDAGGAGAAPGDGGGLADGVLADLDPETLMREERRARLNGEVEAAVVRQSDHKCNVAFVKTHKTASTTLAGVLYRYGLRHGRRVARFQVEGTAVTLEHAAIETEESGKRVEIFHYHYVWDGYFKSTWDQAKKLFKRIMVDPSADADAAGGGADGGSGGGTKFVTVLRDPVDHWLSYFYFYYEPEMKMGVEDYFKLGRHKARPLNNPLAAEFGIYDERQLDEFILNHLPGFALTMLTEKVDEGLVLLGRVMDWDPIDLTYASLLEARDGATRWDDKPVTKAPRKKDLHSATLNDLERVTNLDKALFKAATREYQKVKDQYSEGLEEEVAKFQELQTDVKAVLNEGVGRGGKVSPARAWYMPESDYFFYSTDKSKWYTEEYYPEPLPF